MQKDKIKPKASENKAKDTETKQKRKELAAELGELTFERAKLTECLNENAKRSNEVATEMEKLSG